MNSIQPVQFGNICNSLFPCVFLLFSALPFSSNKKCSFSLSLNTFAYSSHLDSIRVDYTRKNIYSSKTSENYAVKLRSRPK